MSFHYNKPELIRIQFKALNKFLKNNFEYIVFNDSQTENINKQIKETCKNLNILCVNFPQYLHDFDYYVYTILLRNSALKQFNEKQLEIIKYHYNHWNKKNPSYRHSNVIQFALDNYGYNFNGIICLMDADLILMNYFNIYEFMKDYVIVGVSEPPDRYKIKYFWPGIVFFDVRKLPAIKSLQFGVSFIDNTIMDTGASCIHYLRQNPSLKIKIDQWKCLLESEQQNDKTLEKLGFTNFQINFIKKLKLKKTLFELTWHLDNNFFHFGHISFKEDSENYKIFIKYLNENL